jgi:hypothetical protein
MKRRFGLLTSLALLLAVTVAAWRYNSAALPSHAAEPSRFNRTVSQIACAIGFIANAQRNSSPEAVHEVSRSGGASPLPLLNADISKIVQDLAQSAQLSEGEQAKIRLVLETAVQILADIGTDPNDSRRAARYREMEMRVNSAVQNVVSNDKDESISAYFSQTALLKMPTQKQLAVTR